MPLEQQTCLAQAPPISLHNACDHKLSRAKSQVAHNYSYPATMHCLGVQSLINAFDLVLIFTTAYSPLHNHVTHPKRASGSSPTTILTQGPITHQRPSAHHTRSHAYTTIHPDIILTQTAHTSHAHKASHKGHASDTLSQESHTRSLDSLT